MSVLSCTIVATNLKQFTQFAMGRYNMDIWSTKSSTEFNSLYDEQKKVFFIPALMFLPFFCSSANCDGTIETYDKVQHPDLNTPISTQTTSSTELTTNSDETMETPGKDQNPDTHPVTSSHETLKGQPTCNEGKEKR